MKPITNTVELAEKIITNLINMNPKEKAKELLNMK